jgi:hypothetical protein
MGAAICLDTLEKLHGRDTMPLADGYGAVEHRQFTFEEGRR